MTKKISFVAFVLLVLIAGVPAVKADSFMPGDFIAYTDSNPPAPGVSGIGERWISMPPPSVDLVNPIPTFCVSLKDLSASTMYIGNITTFGGSSNVPLTPAVAFLYTQFRNGSLAGYDFNGPNLNVDAEELQYAIWILMSQTTIDSVPDLLKADVQAFENLGLNSGWENVGDVRILNLYRQDDFGQEPYDPSVYTTRAQDLLTIVPEPTSLLLLGSGLVLLASLARFKRS